MFFTLDNLYGFNREEKENQNYIQSNQIGKHVLNGLKYLLAQKVGRLFCTKEFKAVLSISEICFNHIRAHFDDVFADGSQKHSDDI
jgi:hypothetical protein